MLRLEVLENEIKIFIRKKTKGKIRFKKFNQEEIGEQITQSQINLKDSKQYIEWLITYNTNVNRNNFDLNWLIPECIYRDMRGKKRHPYELSKILCEMKQKFWITNNDLQDLINEIQSYITFLDDIPTYIQNENEKINLGKLDFKIRKWIVPIFRVYNSDGTFIEAVKEKQQFAYQMQIMVYFCIPFTANSSIAQNPKDSNEIVYTLIKEKNDPITNLVKVFGCASKRHQHDIIEILKCIQKNCEGEPLITKMNDSSKLFPNI
jgi:hypothetical protein